MSMATFVEVSIVIDARHGAAGLRDLDREAFGRFGKGRHRAALNYGDCFSYALAASLAEPFLCKGSDFRHTDLALAE